MAGDSYFAASDSSTILRPLKDSEKQAETRLLALFFSIAFAWRSTLLSHVNSKIEAGVKGDCGKKQVFHSKMKGIQTHCSLCNQKEIAPKSLDSRSV